MTPSNGRKVNFNALHVGGLIFPEFVLGILRWHETHVQYQDSTCVQ